MGDFYGVCALLAALMFFVLIQKFDKKFGKVEKELDEIKKRMDAFLKAQERIASDHVQSKENVSAEAVEDTCIPPHAANEIPVLKKELLRKEEQLEAPQGMMAENNVTSEIPVVTPSVRKQKKVNYEKFIGENLFGKIGILVFVIGVGFFVKYAIDKDWINETLRTVLGFRLCIAGCCRTSAKEVPYIQFLACGWSFRCLLSYGSYCLSFLSSLPSDCRLYYSDSYNTVHVDSVCPVRQARTGHHFIGRRIPGTFYRQQWRW